MKPNGSQFVASSRKSLKHSTSIYPLPTQASVVQPSSQNNSNIAFRERIQEHKSMMSKTTVKTSVFSGRNSRFMRSELVNEESGGNQFNTNYLSPNIRGDILHRRSLQKMQTMDSNPGNALKRCKKISNEDMEENLDIANTRKQEKRLIHGEELNDKGIEKSKRREQFQVKTSKKKTNVTELNASIRNLINGNFRLGTRMSFRIDQKRKNSIQVEVPTKTREILNMFCSDSKNPIVQSMNTNSRRSGYLGINTPVGKRDRDDIWKEASAIDPVLVRNKKITSESVVDIKLMMRKRFSETFVKVQRLGTDICGQAHRQIVAITEPIKEEWRNKRLTLISKVKEFLFFIIALKIPHELLFEFPTKAYQHPRGLEFIEAAKLGKADKLSEMLFKCSALLAYEYDHFRQTALHWACKRNFRSCGEILIEANSYNNAIDIYGRTPLYYAIKNQNVILVYLMLVKHASPWSPKNVNYIDLTNKNEQIIYYLKKFRLLELMKTFQKSSEREAFRKNYIAKNVKPPF